MMTGYDLSSVGAQKVKGKTYDLSHLGANKNEKDSAKNSAKLLPFNKQSESETRSQLRKTVGEGEVGGAQGLINIIPDTLNMLNPTSYKIPRANFAPNTQASQLGQMAAPFAGPQGLEYAGAKALSYFPKALNAVRELTAVKKGQNIKNALLNVGKTAGSTGYINALEHPDNPWPEFGKGAMLGAAGAVAAPAAVSSTPLLATAGKAGLGYLAGAQIGHPVSGALMAMGLPVRSFLGLESKTGIAKDMLSGLENKDVAKVVAANKRLGTHTTPAESSGNYVTGSKEGALKRTVEGGQTGYRFEEREKFKQNKAVNSMLDKIYKPTKANEAKINSLYERAYDTRHDVDPTVVASMMHNPTVSRVAQKVSEDPAFANVSPTNYRFLAQVDRRLYDEQNMLLSSSSGADRVAGNDMKQHYKTFNSFLKNHNQDYAQAAAAAEPKIVRRNMETKLNKENEDLTAKSVYQKLFNSRKNFRQVLHDVRNSPEAKQDLIDMRTGWKHLSNVKPVGTAAEQSRTWIDQARNLGHYAQNVIKNIAGAKGDTARLAFIYSPDWEKGFDLIAKSNSNKERMTKLSNFLIKSAVRAGLTTNQAQNLMSMITQNENESSKKAK